MIPDYLSELGARIAVKIAHTPFPRPIQCFLNRLYIRWFKIDMSEFETENPCLYPTLNNLFIRYKKVIEFYEEENILISPADGIVVAEGEIKKGEALQIKGISYSIARLLGDRRKGGNGVEEKKRKEREKESERIKVKGQKREGRREEEISELVKRLEGGVFINIYLSPRDYHRFHAPTDMEVERGWIIGGGLKSVRPSVLKREPVFTENRRVVLECRDGRGNRFYFIAVGAIVVGRIVFNFDSRLSEIIPAGEIKEFNYQKTRLKKGEELGRFEFGSSILLLFPPETFKYLNQKERVEVGDILGELF